MDTVGIHAEIRRLPARLAPSVTTPDANEVEFERPFTAFAPPYRRIGRPDRLFAAEGTVEGNGTRGVAHRSSLPREAGVANRASPSASRRFTNVEKVSSGASPGRDAATPTGGPAAPVHAEQKGEDERFDDQRRAEWRCARRRGTDRCDGIIRDRERALQRCDDVY